MVQSKLHVTKSTFHDVDKQIKTENQTNKRRQLIIREEEGAQCCTEIPQFYIMPNSNSWVDGQTEIGDSNIWAAAPVQKPSVIAEKGVMH